MVRSGSSTAGVGKTIEDLKCPTASCGSQLEYRSTAAVTEWRAWVRFARRCSSGTALPDWSITRPANGTPPRFSQGETDQNALSPTRARRRQLKSHAITVSASMRGGAVKCRCRRESHHVEAGFRRRTRQTRESHFPPSRSPNVSFCKPYPGRSAAAQGRAIDISH